MRTLNLDHLTDHQKQTLTGCSNTVLDELKTTLREQEAHRPGRPLKHSIEQRLYLTLFKLRTNLSYLAIEAITGVDAVTASRIVKSVVACLAGAAMTERTQPIFLIVDATVTRCDMRQPRYYSGHKHYKGVKTPVVCDQRRIIRHVPQPWPASVHDKTIWTHERHHIVPMSTAFILGDKAYAGAFAKQAIIRPAKKNETDFRVDPDRAKRDNRIISALRVRIEHVIGSLKRYKIVAERFPLALHTFHACMMTVALIHNLQITTKVAS